MKQNRRGRPEKYTKELVGKLLQSANKAGVDFKTHVTNYLMVEGFGYTPKQIGLIYSAMHTAAARHGLIEVKHYNKK